MAKKKDGDIGPFHSKESITVTPIIVQHHMNIFVGKKYFGRLFKHFSGIAERAWRVKELIRHMSQDTPLKSFLDIVSSSPVDNNVGFSKSRRRRQRERQQTKGLMSRTMVLHVRFDSLYISLPSSAKQQREMTKLYVL